LGWSQNELARRAEVNHPTLFKIEADQRLNPSISVIVRIARALGTTAEALYGWERDDARLIVEANKTTMLVDVRSLGKKPSDAAQSRAKSFVAAALERAGAKVRDAGRTGVDEAAEAPLPAHAAQLAAGGLALVEELHAIRVRLDALEGRRQGQEGRVRKRAAR
jgi:DNA-binding XRE family transcriptional regulator